MKIHNSIVCLFHLLIIVTKTRHHSETNLWRKQIISQVRETGHVRKLIQTQITIGGLFLSSCKQSRVANMDSIIYRVKIKLKEYSP